MQKTLLQYCGVCTIRVCSERGLWKWNLQRDQFSCSLRLCQTHCKLWVQLMHSISRHETHRQPWIVWVHTPDQSRIQSQPCTWPHTSNPKLSPTNSGVGNRDSSFKQYYQRHFRHVPDISSNHSFWLTAGACHTEAEQEADNTGRTHAFFGIFVCRLHSSTTL